MANSSHSDALERFRAIVRSDAALEAALARHEQPEAFVAHAIAAAEQNGFALHPEDLGPAAHPDRVGLARQSVDACVIKAWPSGDWFPARIVGLADGRAAVDWAHFAGAPLSESFFALSLQRAIARPFNRLFRFVTPLDDFIDKIGAEQARLPDGLIFHMSRCGSTLVTRMLMAIADSLIVSEAQPLNDILAMALRNPWSEQRRIAALRAMINALGRRSQVGRPYILKLHCWHALALPLFRAAFPNVPWLFIYREPAEILASQMRMRGPELIPEMMSPSWYGIEPDPEMPAEAYCARALARIAGAAADQLELGNGLAVNYDELPEAVVSKILRHFGLEPREAEQAEMRQAALRDSKNPSRIFTNAAGAKAGADVEALRNVAERHLGAAFDRLQALRSGGTGPSPSRERGGL